MGFTAIWISPVTYNLPQNTAYGYAYHGYWQQDLYKLNSNFGTAADLKNLAAALHSRGMYLMVDIVVNHNGWAGSSSSVNYGSFNPFNSASYYHQYCTIDYNNQTSIEDCWLGDSNVELPDLKTESTAVASGYQTWIKKLVSDYSIDGLRIDTAKHVHNTFWSGFSSAAGVFMTGEVYDGNPSNTCSYQAYMDSVLNYPIYYALTSAFQSTSGSMSGLANMINTVKSTCKDSTLLGSFSENHDVPRFPSLNGDLSLAKNLITYTLLADGVPIIYEGQEQHYNALGGSNDPYNREAIWFSGYSTSSPLYRLIAAVNQLRNEAIYNDGGYLTYQNYPIYTDATTIAMRKGYAGKQIITVLSNKGANGAAYTLQLGNTGFTSGMKVVDVLTCATVTADAGGKIAVPMANGLPRVYYPAASLSGSGICGH
ncbi:hypothetical protein LTR50_001611 [Elasticomyces elasticus]|nr:hypothetical protein LTR50_001611 [Elasticomyces elasticus]